MEGVIKDKSKQSNLNIEAVLKHHKLTLKNVVKHT